MVGETLGMRGGVLTIGGNAGSLLGERMRRGLVIVGGDAGDYAGGRMVAGTILFKRRVGRDAGYGLRRGSLIFVEEPKDLLPTFGDCGVLEFDYLRLLEHWLRDNGKSDQSRRSRPQAHGRHGGARQGRDADPGLSRTSRSHAMLTSERPYGLCSLAHADGARPACTDDRFPLRPSRRQPDAGRPQPALYRARAHRCGPRAGRGRAALDQIEAGLARGLHAAGFFAYELGYCLEPKLKAPSSGRPQRSAVLARALPRASPARRCRHPRLARRARRRRAGHDLRPQTVLDARAL